MLDEAIRPSDTNHWSLDSQAANRFQYCAAESPGQHVIFERENDIDFARIEFDHLGIDRLGKAGVNHGRRHAFTLQLRRDLVCHENHVAQGKNSYLILLSMLE